MIPEPSISDRLGEIAGALRSPLARDLSGAVNAIGAPQVDGLRAILAELPEIRANTPADALALASIARDMLEILAANADGNAIAYQATVTLAQSLDGLKRCLADMAGRPASDFAVVPLVASEPIQ